MTAAIYDNSPQVVVHLPQLGVSPLDNNPMGLKCVAFELPDSASGGAQFTVDISKYGMDNIYDVLVFQHTTKDDIITTEQKRVYNGNTATAGSFNMGTAFTSVLSGTNFTISMIGGAVTIKRVVVLWGT